MDVMKPKNAPDDVVLCDCLKKHYSSANLFSLVFFCVVGRECWSFKVVGGTKLRKGD